MSDIQAKVDKVFDLMREEDWHPEEALRVLTACLGSTALSCNVEINTLTHVTSEIFKHIYGDKGGVQ